MTTRFLVSFFIALQPEFTGETTAVLVNTVNNFLL